MPERTPFLGSIRPTGVDIEARERCAFYSSKRWAKHRRAYLAKNPLCVRCLAEGTTKAASVVHHKVERLADPRLAWEWTNFESICPRHHVLHHLHTDAQEARGEAGKRG